MYDAQLIHGRRGRRVYVVRAEFPFGCGASFHVFFCTWEDLLRRQNDIMPVDNSTFATKKQLP